ncbi:hypothetical protein [Amycolatopsis australiensis]|uniref:hypothetical protein n=1 Tax=Amycolatopsis australiensis TaxID=546364 RepID=UPI0015A6C470|nr:hypothetical protein [Amycolatopsis australiensis]
MTQPHDEVGEEDSSGNRIEEPPRREESDTPLEDEEARAKPGHPASHENFRGSD